MGFGSILDMQEVPEAKRGVKGAYFLDFNIDRILNEMKLIWKEDVSKYYTYFPKNKEVQEYRKEVYEDIFRGNVFSVLSSFRELMKTFVEIGENQGKTRSVFQQKFMELNRAEYYVKAVEILVKGLGEEEIKSKGLQEFLLTIKEYSDSEHFKALKEKIYFIREGFGRIRMKISIMDHFLSVDLTETKGEYDSFLDGIFQDNELKKMKSPFGEEIEVSALEDEVLAIVTDKYPDLYAEVKAFPQFSEGFVQQYIVRFYEEIGFYLAFYVFEKHMKEEGFCFSRAQIAENDSLQAEDLYDLALACQNYRAGKAVVKNDVLLKENENFFVLTGPNQGGKTTFARSLGQLVYFSKLGLHVPARKAQVPFYGKVLTHFSVEESIETGKGKLAEELSRLAPMMDESEEEKAFVVINELFTTAANYDAIIMGKRVLEHFVSKDCKGIYVTHLSDLSKEENGIVSLRATMDENNKQSFKIVRSNEKAAESSIILVEKHGLNAESLKERLRGL